MKTLSALKNGTVGKIIELDTADISFRQRLLAMGLIRGTLLRVIRRAPLGDPLQIEVRGFSLSLRKIEADLIRVETEI